MREVNSSKCPAPPLQARQNWRGVVMPTGQIGGFALIHRTGSCYFLLAATFSASGQSAGSNRTLNLRGLQFQTAHASGSSLFLSVTGQPPVSIITP